MNNGLKLSKRLEKVASLLSKGTFFADIGSDHAYLPSFVCLKDKDARAISGEINVGPYNSSRKTVEFHQLTEVIDVRLGDGLEVVGNDNINELVIAGMGGSLITSILEHGKGYLSNVKRIIVQPNIGAEKIRKWFLDNNYTLTNEFIVMENNQFYEILVANYSSMEQPYNEKITEKQLLFGPYLLEEKPREFYLKWKREYQNLALVLEQMKKATIQNKPKINRVETKLIWMKEVLQNGETHQ